MGWRIRVPLGTALVVSVQQVVAMLVGSEMTVLKSLAHSSFL
jgi:hypothetical protein